MIATKVKQFAESKGYKYEIVPENDSDKFSKYNIQYIPTCIIIKNDKHEKLSGEISAQTIENTIKSM